MKTLGVIPARWASSRFPGKMLAPLAGKPLVQWVVERAARATLLDRVVVATDDQRIADAMTTAGFEAVMTRGDHPSGTDRVAEAASGSGADILVNIQGDEPLIEPQLIDALVAALAESTAWDMATAMAPLNHEAALRSPDVVKVVADEAGRALYFSRAPIPFVRDTPAPARPGLHWRHIGLYGYRAAFLARMVAAPPCAAEEAEKLEQLRALHLGGRIRLIATEHTALGVDTPADLEEAERLVRAQEMSETMHPGERP